MTCKAFAAVLMFIFTGAGSAHARVLLANAINDHAVLRRGVPIRIWGWATPAVKLTVQLHAQTISTTADRFGEWTAWLMPESAGGPYTLTVQGEPTDSSKALSDIWIGDVWLASDQYDMQIPLSGFPLIAPIRNGPAENAVASNPMLRLLQVTLTSSDYPLDDINASWTQCIPETAAGFSAFACFFGQVQISRGMGIGQCLRRPSSKAPASKTLAVDFRVRSSSPAVLSGTPWNESDIDAAGRHRSMAGSLDRGAYLSDVAP